MPSGISHSPLWAMFDSLAIGAEGNICMATLNMVGITVVSPQGEILGIIPLPLYRPPRDTNICCRGPQLDIACGPFSGRGAVWRSWIVHWA